MRLDEALSRYRLPAPPEGEDNNVAIRASLRTWEVAPDGLAIPQHAAAFRTAMGETDHSVHVVGPTGRASPARLLSQRHFGAGHARHLLSWASTENAIEAHAFTLKNALVVLDDFAPQGNSNNQLRWHTKADRVMRAKGDAAGRARMGGGPSQCRPTNHPQGPDPLHRRGHPSGQLLRARCSCLEHGEGDVVCEKLHRVPA